MFCFLRSAEETMINNRFPKKSSPRIPIENTSVRGFGQVNF